MIDDLANWEMSRAFIHDKDKKFLFVFWKAIFKKLSVQFLAFVVYHSQTNDQSERTNQIVEIVLRYALTINLDLDWMIFLSILRARLNNFFNASIDLSSNEIIMRSKTRDSFALLRHDESSKNWLKRKTINVIKTKVVIVWVNLTIKIIYDKHHKSLKLKIDDQVFLRLHKEYFLSFVKFFKLSIQRIESFKILERKSDLTYKLDILKNWKIHFVIFIVHLESILNDDDFYDRERSSYSKSIVEFNKNWHDYEVESLLKHRIKRYDRDKSMFECLIKWKDYEAKFDKWYDEDLLEEVTNLVNEYKTKHDTSMNNVTRRLDSSISIIDSKFTRQILNNAFEQIINSKLVSQFKSRDRFARQFTNVDVEQTQNSIQISQSKRRDRSTRQSSSVVFELILNQVQNLFARRFERQRRLVVSWVDLVQAWRRKTSRSSFDDNKLVVQALTTIN